MIAFKTPVSDRCGRNKQEYRLSVKTKQRDLAPTCPAPTLCARGVDGRSPGGRPATIRPKPIVVPSTCNRGMRAGWDGRVGWENPKPQNLQLCPQPAQLEELSSSIQILDQTQTPRTKTLELNHKTCKGEI